MDLAQLACPLCAGEFAVEPAWQGQQVACPHCEQAVTVPEFEHASPPPFSQPVPEIFIEEPESSATESVTPPANVESAPARTSRIDEILVARRLPSNEAADSPFAIHEPTRHLINRHGEKIPLRRRTPSEQARFRRRLHTSVAIVGGVVLLLLLYLLLQVE